MVEEVVEVCGSDDLMTTGGGKWVVKKLRAREKVRVAACLAKL